MKTAYTRAVQAGGAQALSHCLFRVVAGKAAPQMAQPSLAALSPLSTGSVYSGLEHGLENQIVRVQILAKYSLYNLGQVT